MKKFMLILAIIAIASAGCEKDPCKEVVCQNGGECIEGNCDCPEGFSGPNCETIVVVETDCNKDNCKNGKCVNDKCQCDEGYTGKECNKEKVPAEIHISKVDVLSYAATKSNGDPWDPSDGADIYVQIFKELTNRIWTSTDTFENADPNTTYSFESDSSIVIDSVSGTYSFVLYDFDDPGTDEQMDGYTVQPYDLIQGKGFPATIDLKSTGSDIHMRLHVTYKF